MKKNKPTDGLGPKEIQQIRNALRKVWQWSHARRLTIKRCMDSDGFTYCEKCKATTPKLKVDHIRPCGEVDEGYIARLFCPSVSLQGLCKKCHDQKTKEERKNAMLLGAN